MNRDKTAGIVCEQYKIPAFKKRLEAAGYEFEVKDFNTVLGRQKGVKLVKIKFALDEIPALTKLCKEAQIDAKLSN